MQKEWKIKTTGELRSYLAMLMVGVKSGDIDIEKARNITKLAGQINESFYSEIKVAKVRLETGEEMVKLGDMNIGGSES